MDTGILDQLDRLDPDGTLVEELADQFLADARDELVSLNRAMVADDADTLRRSAHTLRGSSANLGATELARLCTLLSGARSPLVPGGLDPIVEAMGIELERVEGAFAARVPVR